MTDPPFAHFRSTEVPYPGPGQLFHIFPAPFLPHLSDGMGTVSPLSSSRSRRLPDLPRPLPASPGRHLFTQTRLKNRPGRRIR